MSLWDLTSAATGLALWAAAAAWAATRVKETTVAVKDTPRQTFRGFGTSSLPNPDYTRLTAEQRDTLGKLLWGDLNLKVMRLWFDVKQYAPEPGKRDLGAFRDGYVRAGRIKVALDHGCEHLLLAPCADFPAWLRGPKPAPKAGEKGEPAWPLVAPGKEVAYAFLLANVIQELRDHDQVRITATGLYNEPNPAWGYEWMVKTTKLLRAELDKRGLKDVLIIAPETCNTDWVWDGFAAAFEKDPEALRALGGTASHSYNMAGNASIDAFTQRTGKDYWMTEAGGNGPEFLPDTEIASSAASRFLGDFNHGVTHWIWFLGDEHHDPRDDKTRLIRWWPNPDFRYELLTQYNYLLHLSRAFVPGTVARRCVSSENGSMSWTYGIKPWLSAAAGVRPDGTWVLAACNNTSDRYKPVPPVRLEPGEKPKDDPDPLSTLKEPEKPGPPPPSPPSKWEREQGLHEARNITATFELPRGSPLAEASFRIFRSNGQHSREAEGETQARQGRVTITVPPMELVTLESVP